MLVVSGAFRATWRGFLQSKVDNKRLRYYINAVFNLCLYYLRFDEPKSAGGASNSRAGA